jgi:hypothetical protein
LDRCSWLELDCTSSEAFAAGVEDVTVLSPAGDSGKRYSIAPRVISGLEWYWFLDALAVSATRRIYFWSSNEFGSLSILENA